MVDTEAFKETLGLIARIRAKYADLDKTLSELEFTIRLKHLWPEGYAGKHRIRTHTRRGPKTRQFPNGCVTEAMLTSTSGEERHLTEAEIDFLFPNDR